MKLYQFLANGFEECEALGTVDVCTRASMDVIMVSVTGNLLVESAHGVKIMANQLFEECDFNDADILMLPGGIPGATNLLAHNGVCEALKHHFQDGKMIAAICAAPLVLGQLGLLKGKKATCYPGFEDQLIGATSTSALVEKDGQIITGKGPGASFALGYAIVEHFRGTAVAEVIKEGMIYNF